MNGSIGAIAQAVIKPIGIQHCQPLLQQSDMTLAYLVYPQCCYVAADGSFIYFLLFLWHIALSSRTSVRAVRAAGVRAASLWSPCESTRPFESKPREAASAGAPRRLAGSAIKIDCATKSL